MSDFTRNRSESSPPTIQTNFSRFSPFFTHFLYQSTANTLNRYEMKFCFLEEGKIDRYTNHVCVSNVKWKYRFFEDVKGSNMREELGFIKYFCNCRETKIFLSIFWRKKSVEKYFASLSVFMYEVYILFHWKIY